MHNQAADTLPEPIGRYGVTGKFGEGRMEVACKPHDAQLDQSVTIKTVCEAIDDAVAAFVQADGERLLGVMDREENVTSTV